MFNPMSDRTASIALFAAAAFWGLYWWPLRLIESSGLSANWAIAVFNATPVLVLVPLVIWHRKEQFRHFRQALLIGAFMGIGLGFYASGLVISSVIRATMLFYLTPIWSTLIGVFWLREALTLARITAIVAGLAGLWLLLSGGDDFSKSLNYGDFSAIAAGVLWGMGAASIKRWPQTPTLMVTTIQFGFVVVFCSLVAHFGFKDPLPSATMLGAAAPVAFGLSVLILLPTAYVMFVTAKQLFPGRVGILMMSEVLVAILSASILLPEETLSLWQWLGGGIVLTACLIEILARDRAI